MNTNRASKYLGHLLTVFMLLIAASCTSSRESSQKEEEADLYYSMGTNALINKNYTIALTQLLKAEELSPKRSDIQNNLGMAYYFKNNYNLAQTHILKSLELDPKNSDARSNYASLLSDRKKYKEAITEYNKILEDLTYPKQYLTYYNLGKIQYDLKKFDKASEFFKLSIKENPSACASHFYLGLMSYKMQQYKSAQKYFKDAYYGTCYSNEEPLFYHALSLEKDHNFQGAIGRYQELIDRFPQSELAAKAKNQLKLINIQTATSLPGEKAMQSDDTALENISDPNLKTDTDNAIESPSF